MLKNWRLLLALALLSAPASAQPRASDPWPNSEVLTRLFVLRPSDGARLAREVGLSPAQVSELRRLAGSERSYGRAAGQVLGRAEAQVLNAKLAQMRAEKDRKVQASLGRRYPAFRAWVRGWWAAQVQRAQPR